MLCLEGDTIEFILPDVCSASWMCTCMFITFGYFLIIISSHFLSVHFFSTSPSRISLMYMLVHLIVSYRSLRLCSFFYILFPCNPQTRSSLNSSLLIVSSGSSQISSEMKFLFQLLCFSTQEFQFGHFVSFLFVF